MLRGVTDSIFQCFGWESQRLVRGPRPRAAHAERAFAHTPGSGSQTAMAADRRPDADRRPEDKDDDSPFGDTDQHSDA